MITSLWLLQPIIFEKMNEDRFAQICVQPNARCIFVFGIDDDGAG